MNRDKVVYNVSDIKEILGVGKNQAYMIVKAGYFPIRKVGRRIIIPKRPFDDWLGGQ